MRRLIIYTICLFLVSACVDVIDFPTPQADRIITIDASITAGESIHEVFISNSGRFDIQEVPADLALSGATVYVEDADGNRSEFVELIGGVYVNTTLIPMVGRQYQLIVELGGNTFESDFETMPTATPISGTSFETFVKESNNEAGNIIMRDFIRVKVNADIDQDDYYRYRVDGTYQYNERASPRNLNPKFCYVEEVIDQNVNVIVDGDDFASGSFENLAVLDLEVDYKFAQNYCFTVHQAAINRSAYDFWEKVNREFDRTGDIFETPPDQIKGNVSSTDPAVQVIGVFTLRAASQAQLLVNRVDVGSPRSNCSFRDEFESCTDCLVISRSSLNKPTCFD